MIYTVLGKRPVSFTANDGKTISGLTVYAGTDIEGEGSVGLACDKFFISTEKLPKADTLQQLGRRQGFQG